METQIKNDSVNLTDEDIEELKEKYMKQHMIIKKKQELKFMKEKKNMLNIIIS